MEVKELLSGFLSKTLNIDTDGVASLFNEDGTIKDDAEQRLIELDAARVKELKSGTKKESFDDGYKKAQSEVMKKLEEDFKTKTGHKSEKKGIDLFLEYATTASTKDDKITEETIKKHPMYLTLQEEKERAVQEAIAQGEQKLNQFKTELSKKETFGSVANKALEIFNNLKPILSSDPNKRKAQEELFVERLQGFDYEIQDGNRIVILKDGKVLEDAHGKRVDFERLVKETATKYYDFQAADPKQNAGNGKNDNGSGINVIVPKNDDEYAAALLDAKKSVEEKNLIKEAYAKSKGQQN